MKELIEKLYSIFQSYQIDDFSKVGCFDYGPSTEELEGISLPLREIPVSIIKSMEFYGYGWEEWGTESEVKYFLPRILEVLQEDVQLLDQSGFFSFFKYKLTNCLKPMNADWSDIERSALGEFFESLLRQNLQSTIQVGSLIEAMIEVGMSVSTITLLWVNTTIELRLLQIPEVLLRFKDWRDPDFCKITPQIKELKDWAECEFAAIESE